MSIISALIPAVVAFFQPFLGVLVLLITLWLSPLFPGSGAFTFNRFVGIATFAGIVSKKAILKSDTKSFVIGKFDYYFWAYLVTILVSV